MFNRTCLVCKEKDNRIEDLKKQVDLLTSLAFPPRHENEKTFMASIEANKLLEGSTEQVQLSEDEIQAMDMLSGTY